MGWYRRGSKLLLDVFRSCSISKTAVPKNPNRKLISTTTGLYGNSFKSSFNKLGISQFSQPIVRNSAFQNGLKSIQCHSPFLQGAKRFYNVDRNRVCYLTLRRRFERWCEDPRNVIAIVLVASGAVITIIFGNLEDVPYTKRTHFILLPKRLEIILGEAAFKNMKEDDFKGKLLSPLQPESIRLQRIANQIIEALQRGLGKEKVLESDANYSPVAFGLPAEPSGPHTLMGSAQNVAADKEKSSKEDIILDDDQVEKSRKKGVTHLEGLKWEVIVVNEPTENAFCIPGGKIVVFTGLLKHFTTDSEIATIIGHEVAHAVARHSAETITKNLWLAIIDVILYLYVMDDIVSKMSTLLLKLPFSRKMEMEADYIGLLLLASAGYDPRAAPQVYEKLGRIGGDDSALQDYLSTHPSGKKRAQLLAQAKVMEEALDLYREVQLGRGIEGFL